MKIGLIGYGKMGKAIEAIALERGHTISFRVNSELPISAVNLKDADVCIEFSQPKLALNHIETLLTNKIPTVVGTTGWNDAVEQVENWVTEHDGSLVHASNFSIGVNLFFQLNEYLAKLMSPHLDYKIYTEEIHHTQKLDYPSGTSITLAEGILENNANFNAWKSSLNEPIEIENDQFPIVAKRIENVPGTHRIQYKSEIDEISIEHVANNRKGFALGAVVAAEWIVNNKGIHTFKDTIKSTL